MLTYAAAEEGSTTHHPIATALIAHATAVLQRHGVVARCSIYLLY
jgi:hypothetical protein